MHKNFGLVAAVAACLLPALSGCGGGSDGAPTLNGVWRNVSLRRGNTVVTCPGSVTVGGDELSCGANDTVTFGNSTFRDDSRDELGRPQRTFGTYLRNGDDLVITLTGAATDLNGNGVYEPDEIEEQIPPLTETLQIEQLTDDLLVLRFNNIVRATYSR